MKFKIFQLEAQPSPLQCSYVLYQNNVFNFNATYVNICVCYKNVLFV